MSLSFFAGASLFRIAFLLALLGFIGYRVISFSQENENSFGPIANPTKETISGQDYYKIKLPPGLAK